METITKEDFEAFEKIRKSGLTNMFAINNVSQLSGLKPEKITLIRANYNELKEKFNDKTN